MLYLAGAVTVAYYLRFIFYFRKMFPPKKSNVFLIIVVTSWVVAVNAFSAVLKIRPFSIFFIAVPMILGLKCVTGMKWRQAAYGGIISVLVAYSFRGFITSIFTLTMPEHYGIILKNENFYYFMTILALPCAILYFELLRLNVAKDQNLKRLLESERPLTAILIFEGFLMFLLLLLNHGRYLDHSYNMWYTWLTFSTSVMALAAVILMVNYSVRLCDLIYYRQTSLLMEEQVHLQIRHYNAYKDYIQGMRAFKHDFNVMSVSVLALLSAGETKKAEETLKNMQNNIKQFKTHTDYSDNVILDALLNDANNRCIENEIKFDAQVHVPKTTDLGLIDSVRIFSNIISNAVEACLKVPAESRFIKIQSFLSGGWCVLECKNTYNGILLKDGEEILTDKKERDFHGFGLKIIRHAVEGIGGFIKLEGDASEKVFTISIFIPQTKPPEIT